jgi:hypothetical protein
MYTFVGQYQRLNAMAMQMRRDAHHHLNIMEANLVQSMLEAEIRLRLWSSYVGNTYG